MSFLETLVTWANVPFTSALVTVLGFAGLQATGLLGLLGGGEGGHDADHDNVDHDVDTDHDVETEHEVDADHDTDHDADQETERAGRDLHVHGPGLLATMGVGRIPTSMVWQTFAMMFGMIGIVTNSIIWMTTQHLPAVTLAVSFPVAVLGSFGITAAVARTIARVVTTAEASGRRDLVGLPGVVVTGQVDDQFGEIRVKLPEGDFVQVTCRVLPGEKPINHHEDVVVVKYDHSEDHIYVARVMPEPGEPGSGSERTRV